jgi:hypothetical protein
MATHSSSYMQTDIATNTTITLNSPSQRTTTTRTTADSLPFVTPMVKKEKLLCSNAGIRWAMPRRILFNSFDKDVDVTNSNVATYTKEQ